MRRLQNSASKFRRPFRCGRLFVFAALIGFTIFSVESGDATVGSSAAPAAALNQAEDISITPPRGITGDAMAQPATLPTDPNQAAILKRGAYLAVAGDCQYCHSLPGGPPYAGGQPVQTPFGDLYTPNITPDKKFGIGNWTDAQFWNALHSGIGPGHSLLIFPHYLYPVMPWQDYNKLSYADVMAIKAYLNSIPPVAQKNRSSQMAFPFTIRAGLLAWRLLFFDDRPLQYQPSWSPQVRDGAFLVQALAHCAECHTQRNLLMATEPARYLAGGHILAQSWYAPNITMSKTDGIGSWSSQDLFNFLAHDGAIGPGAPYGPMKAVVDDSLSRLPASAVQDIVAYLQNGTPNLQSDMPPAPVNPSVSANGAQLYQANCARCHGNNGEGVSDNFPNLAGNESLWDGPSEDLTSMILGGYQPWHTGQSSMPEFNQWLNDSQIAAIANYIRTSWGNKGAADATAANVASARLLASDWTELDTASTSAHLQSTGMLETFDDISGEIEIFGDRKNCMLHAHFSDAAATASIKSIYLEGACTKQGSELDGEIVIDGKAYPAALQMSMRGAPRLSNILLFGKLPGPADHFSAQIALVLPNY